LIHIWILKSYGSVMRCVGVYCGSEKKTEKMDDNNYVVREAGNSIITYPVMEKITKTVKPHNVSTYIILPRSVMQLILLLIAEKLDELAKFLVVGCCGFFFFSIFA
jgi:hypothetical protein